MKIILDANIIIASLLGSRGKLNIITSQNHILYAPKKIITIWSNAVTTLT